MLQRRRGGDLLHEPLGAQDRGQFGLQDLERHLALVLEVLGQVDGGHAALAELPLDPVAVGEGGGEAVECAAHLGAKRLSSCAKFMIRLNGSRRGTPAGAESTTGWTRRKRCPSG